LKQKQTFTDAGGCGGYELEINDIVKISGNDKYFLVTGFDDENVFLTHEQDKEIRIPFIGIEEQWTKKNVRKSAQIYTTRIYTKNGLLKIKDIKTGDFVLTHTGEWVQIENDSHDLYDDYSSNIRNELDSALLYFETPTYPAECKRIVNVGINRLNLHLTTNEASKIWEWHSDLFCQSWMELPDDQTIAQIIQYFIIRHNKRKNNIGENNGI